MSRLQEIAQKLSNYVKEQGTALVISKIVFVSLVIVFNFILFITPFVLFEKPTNFLEYFLLFPCHIVPILSYFTLFSSHFSHVVSAILHFVLAMFCFGHTCFLLTYVGIGNAWRLAVIVEFLFMLCSTSLFIIEIVQECRRPKLMEDYSVHTDEYDTTGSSDTGIYKL
jgi:hypothetical protein